MSSGFVTETEAAETRKRRQEEWERVRKPEDPLERPEEPYDGRSLFDRLKEQKNKKDMEYEEAHKLKNLIRGLDDDEVQFLELVDQQKMNAERKQMQEEEKELQEFRSRVATLQEETVEKKMQAELRSTKTTMSTGGSSVRTSQKSLLSVGIKRKNGDSGSPTNRTSSTSKAVEKNTTDIQEISSPKLTKQVISIKTTKYDQGALKCVAILPGIGSYTESSDSETGSSDEELDDLGRYDLCGRKHMLKKKECTGD